MTASIARLVTLAHFCLVTSSGAESIKFRSSDEVYQEATYLLGDRILNVKGPSEAAILCKQLNSDNKGETAIIIQTQLENLNCFEIPLIV